MAQSVEINELHYRMWAKAAEDRQTARKMLQKGFWLCNVAIVFLLAAILLSAHDIYVKKHTVPCPAAGSTDGNKSRESRAAQDTEGVARFL